MTSSHDGYHEAARTLRTLGRRRVVLLEKLDEVEAALAKAVRHASDHGIGPTDISRLAQLSRPTVYKMRERT